MNSNYIFIMSCMRCEKCKHFLATGVQPPVFCEVLQDALTDSKASSLEHSSQGPLTIEAVKALCASPLYFLFCQEKIGKNAAVLSKAYLGVLHRARFHRELFILSLQFHSSLFLAHVAFLGLAVWLLRDLRI
jgi:hypothetical protein